MTTPSRAQSLDHLQRSLAATEPFFTAPSELRTRSYGPGKWTMHQLLVHLADHESVTLDRARRVASEPTVPLLGYDQNRWADGTLYAQRSLEEAGRLYCACRGSLIDLLRVLPADADARTGVHNERGPMTLLQVACTWMHNDHHLAQLEAIRQGRPWTPAR
jgi:hypothetical protein